MYAYSIISKIEGSSYYGDRLEDDLSLVYYGRGKGRDQTLDDFDNKALFLNFRDNVPVRL